VPEFLKAVVNASGKMSKKERGSIVEKIENNLYFSCFLGKLRIWCVASGKLLNAIRAHHELVRSLCTSTTGDGEYIVTTGFLRCSIKLWKCDTLDIKAELVGHRGPVSCVVATGMHVMCI
jgi:WD40 repeat protein